MPENGIVKRPTLAEIELWQAQCRQREGGWPDTNELLCPFATRTEHGPISADCPNCEGLSILCKIVGVENPRD